MFIWPTSELPIWSLGKPTHFSEASMTVWGYVAHRKFQCGLRAWQMALKSHSSRYPKPSSTISRTGVTFMIPYAFYGDAGLL